MAGIERERGARDIGLDRAVRRVDQRQIAVAGADLAGAGDDIVDVRQRAGRRRADDAGIARHRDMAAALQRDAVTDDLQLRVIAGRVQCDRAGIVDRAAERQHRAVADRHGAGVLDDRSLVEHEVVRAERGRMDAVQRDRFAGADSDHRIATGIIGIFGGRRSR